MTGAQSRMLRVAVSAMTIIAPMAVSALAGALHDDFPSGEAATMSKTRGITVTAINITTVPATVGVSRRRNSESFAANRNWNNDEATTSVASRLGPPCSKAVTHTAMNAPEVPISRT